jgi:hypothetical protein
MSVIGKASAPHQSYKCWKRIFTLIFFVVCVLFSYLFLFFGDSREGIFLFHPNMQELKESIGDFLLKKFTVCMEYLMKSENSK